MTYLAGHPPRRTTARLGGIYSEEVFVDELSTCTSPCVNAQLESR